MNQVPEIEIAATCRCGGRIRLVRGLREIFAVNPRAIVPGVFLLAVFMVSAAGALVLEWSLQSLWPSMARSSVLAKMIAFATVPPLVFRYFPIRILFCSNCRRMLRIGFGRVVPLTWQQLIEPDWTCKKCGYSLVGIRDEPYCPECGHGFPQQWLKGTSQGVEHPGYRLTDRAARI
jgi:hypothetical protein